MDLGRKHKVCALIREAEVNPRDESIAALVALVLDGGVHALQSNAVSSEAARLLQNCDLNSTIRHIAIRLATHGVQPPYEHYTGSHLFIDKFIVGGSQSVFTNAAFCLKFLSADLLDRLSEGQFSPESPDRFASAVKDFCKRCAAAAVSPNPYRPVPSTIELLGSTLPESSNRGEIPFLRVLQMQDLSFSAARSLAAEATSHVRFSEASSALCALDFLERLTALFGAPLRILWTGLSVKDWHQVRDFITYPSVIESPAPGYLTQEIRELERLLSHPRFPARDSVTVAVCKDLLSSAHKYLVAWTKSHVAIALHYNAGSDSSQLTGTAWLKAKAKTEEGLFQQSGTGIASKLQST